MLRLNQKNSKWAKTKIGNSNSTIGDYGCLITCLSMFSQWYGQYKDPNWMAKNLQFTKGGLLLWDSITRSPLPMCFIYRYYTADPTKIMQILRSKDGVCLLQVNNNHWVALVGYSRLLGYRINDPLYGDSCWLKQRRYRITGFSELIRKN